MQLIDTLGEHFNRSATTPDTENRIICVIDVQREFTDHERFLAREFFDGEVSADATFLSHLEQQLIVLDNLGAKILQILLVHDLEKMKQTNPERYKAQEEKGLIKDGKPLICAIGSPGIEPSITWSTNPTTRHKCSRSVANDPDFLERLDKNTPIAVCGIDANVCIYESARDLLNRGYKVIIITDLISTRPSEYNEALERMKELEVLGCGFITSEQLISSLEKQ